MGVFRGGFDCACGTYDFLDSYLPPSAFYRIQQAQSFSNPYSFSISISSHCIALALHPLIHHLSAHPHVSFFFILALAPSRFIRLSQRDLVLDCFLRERQVPDS